MLISITAHDSMLMARIRVSGDYGNRRCISYLNNPTAMVTTIAVASQIDACSLAHVLSCGPLGFALFLSLVMFPTPALLRSVDRPVPFILVGVVHPALGGEARIGGWFGELD